MTDIARTTEAALRALTYPESPCRPPDSLSGLDAEARQRLIGQHAAYEQRKADYDADLLRYQRAARDIELTFAEQIGAAYLPTLPRAAQARVFALAWGRGHSDGPHEVECEYDVLARLIQDVAQDLSAARP